ncbi:granzyme B(G,H) [Hypomesus transpacificus]|uniref:granzyme B(G,H) n=1 Tax=Hypomesus transpacificus TaxID=137520 RepID=UPI001F074F60|nr:granzyme B(G,H) [Hypomesus transpacificus]
MRFLCVSCLLSFIKASVMRRRGREEHSDTQQSITMGFSLNLSVLVLMLVFCNQVQAAGIFGGNESVPHSRPYMVLLKVTSNQKTIHCGGFLLREDFVVSAAHCDGDCITAQLGVHDVHNGSEQHMKVKAVYKHPNFTSDFLNDIMLLKLEKKAVFTNHVQPLALPMENDQRSDHCLVCGWGRANIHKRYGSKVLREVNVTVISNDTCKEKHVLCTLGNNRPAEGDSGGPLVCGALAFGVVSYMEDKKNGFIAYTHIPDYLPWICEIVTHH